MIKHGPDIFAQYLILHIEIKKVVFSEKGKIKTHRNYITVSNPQITENLSFCLMFL